MADASPTGPTTSGQIVELRVHGVSGAGADQVLDRPHVDAGRRGPQRRLLPPPPRLSGRRPDAGGVTLEAYRWSDLPSGTAMRTLSLVFLLPFMLCNVAFWMRPAKPRLEAAVIALCRVLALTLTDALRARHRRSRAGPGRLALHRHPVVPGRAELAVLALRTADRAAAGGAGGGSGRRHRAGLVARAPARASRSMRSGPRSQQTSAHRLERASASGTPSRWSGGCVRCTSRPRSPRWTAACWPPGRASTPRR